MHLERVAVIVDDYDEAIRFFVDRVGFELVEDEPALTTQGGRPKRWVMVRPPGGQTGVLLAQADGEHQRAAVGEQFAGRVGLFLRVEDFDAQYERMLNAGVEFVEQPRDEPYGRVAIFLTSPATAGTCWARRGRAERQELSARRVIRRSAGFDLLARRGNRPACACARRSRNVLRAPL